MKSVNPDGKLVRFNHAQIQPILHPEVDEFQEIEAIFLIVFRNLAYLAWSDLVPEAQLQMLEEAAALLESEQLSIEKKVQLEERLSIIEPEVTVGKQRIQEILILHKELILEQRTCA